MKAAAGIRRGAELELEIESLAFGGDGVARADGLVVFVPGALEGQRVRAKITRKKKSHAFARLLEVVRQSPHYAPPRCSHFGDCGGCVLQHLNYSQQVAAKTRQVEEVLQHLAGIENPPVLPGLPAPSPFFYRNKMEFTFGDHRWLTRTEIDSGRQIPNRDFVLGLHVRGRFDRIIDVETCWLQSERSNEIRRLVASRAAESGLRPYTTRDHTGFWRFLVIREGKRTGETLVNIVTADAGAAGEAAVQQLAHDLIEAFPELTTIAHSINRSKAQVAVGEETRILHGPGHIHDRIGDFTFRISPQSFFQTNTEGAEQLYRVAAEFAALTGGERVYDLYCGAGTIGIFLSRSAKEVIGVEVVEEAIADARRNAELNTVTNCRFVVGDLKTQLQKEALFEKFGPPDVIVLDPPRAGVHPKALETIIGAAAGRVVYVSCNPSTFARDARLLLDGGYRLEKVQPVDMFPHTGHIEVVGLFLKPA